MRSGDLTGAPYTGEIDIDHGLPRRLGQLRREPARRDTRCRADNIEPAERRDTTIGSLSQRIGVPDVDDVSDDPAAGFADESRGLVEILWRRCRHRHGLDGSTDVECDDVGALLGEPHRLGPSDPPGRAGDQCDLSCQSTGHVVFCVRPASTTS